MDSQARLGTYNNYCHAIVVEKWRWSLNPKAPETERPNLTVPLNEKHTFREQRQ